MRRRISTSSSAADSEQPPLRVILTKGLPGSGKSTWARQQLALHPRRFKRINKDDLRAMLDDGVWSKRNERFVLAARDALILQALGDGYSVIVDDTNLEPVHEQHIRSLVAGRAEVVIQDFTAVPIEVSIARDAARVATVGERVIRRMHRMYLASPSTPTPTPTPATTPADPHTTLPAAHIE